MKPNKNAQLLISAFFVITTLIKQYWCEQNYIVTNEQIEQIKGDYETLVDFTELKTVRRERLIHGNVTFLEDMDNDNFKFGAEMYSSPNGDGNFKKAAMDVPPTPICDVFKDIYRDLVQPSLKFDDNTNFPVVPDDGRCPLPAGSYYVSMIALDTDSWPSQMPRGIIKIVGKFYKNNVCIGGVICKLKISDKDT